MPPTVIDLCFWQVFLGISLAILDLLSILLRVISYRKAKSELFLYIIVGFIFEVMLCVGLLANYTAEELAGKRGLIIGGGAAGFLLYCLIVILCLKRVTHIGQADYKIGWHR